MESTRKFLQKVSPQATHRILTSTINNLNSFCSPRPHSPPAHLKLLHLEPLPISESQCQMSPSSKVFSVSTLKKNLRSSLYPPRTSPEQGALLKSLSLSLNPLPKQIADSGVLTLRTRGRLGKGEGGKGGKGGGKGGGGVDGVWRVDRGSYRSKRKSYRENWRLDTWGEWFWGFSVKMELISRKLLFFYWRINVDFKINDKLTSHLTTTSNKKRNVILFYSN